MKRVVLMVARDAVGREVRRRFTKIEGVLHYALQADGSWKEFLGNSIELPVLEVTGPDVESIALTLQELRDALGQRGTHYVRIHHCAWSGPKRLRVCLEARPAQFQERRELVDVLIDIYKNPTTISGWEMVSVVMHAATEAAANEDDLETLPDLYKIAVGDD